MAKKLFTGFMIIISVVLMLSCVTVYASAKNSPAPLVSGQAMYNAVTINYSSKTKVSGYEVSYTLTQSSNSVTVYSGIKKSTTISNLPLGSTIIVTVKSYSGSGSDRTYSEPSLIQLSLGLETPVLKSVSVKGVNTLTWTKVKGASSYELSVSTSYSGSYKIVSHVSGLTFTHKVGAKIGRYYRIRAYTVVNGVKIYSSNSQVIYAIS